ncbi:hypothetical protein GCM10007276_11130 [Agaricicola taiwanensis]|uniref:DUF2007 domain-containing protein n=1 Tax=Agaricicola taiwanensis TaxID=591372 RepID=A0A8J2VNE3_9RHOB|nr:DUF2007 domain-containing protein [Agaricicola taiwanensis]GGE35403.1 hypothetical protein GCM10007276_11130 [Agaricicola taiwanensis]
MHELIRTNDVVLLSYVQSLLQEAGIEYLLLDGHMSVLDGSIGAIPRRLLVDEDHNLKARRLLRDHGLGHELRDDRP